MRENARNPSAPDPVEVPDVAPSSPCSDAQAAGATAYIAQSALREMSAKNPSPCNTRATIKQAKISLAAVANIALQAATVAVGQTENNRPNRSASLRPCSGFDSRFLVGTINRSSSQAPLPKKPLPRRHEMNGTRPNGDFVFLVKRDED